MTHREPGLVAGILFLAVALALVFALVCVMSVSGPY